MTSDKLWSLTNREHAALINVWERSHDLPLRIHAAIQATLHNTAGKTYKDHFTSEMFLPGYEKQPQGLQEKMAIAAALFSRKVKCPDCGEFVKAREVHSCHASPIHAQ